MKDSKKLIMEINKAFINGYLDTDIISEYKPYKISDKSPDSWVSPWLKSLTDRELISKIFYYSGRSLQGGNYEYIEDATTLHFLIMEYARRSGGQRI
jgi:hypothetical protein